MDDCLFCKVVDGDIPATIIAETEHTLTFKDINPQAPVHLLVIPKEHHATIIDVAAANPELVSAIVNDAAAAATLEGVGDGWRFVFNNGAKAGQEVFHCHGHIIAGRPLNWPPG